MSRKSRCASTQRSPETDSHKCRRRPRTMFSSTMPASCRPLPSPTPSPMKKPLRSPDGSRCSCCWQA
eukprot:4154673-Prymnesium_polylepis.1